MLLAIIITATITFFFGEAVGFGIHRLAHWPKAGKIFRDHLEHHSVSYPPSRYLSQKYLGDLRTSFIPYFVPLFATLNIIASIVLSWPLFLTFFVVSSIVSLANSFIHDSLHIENHVLTRFKWHKRIREIHFLHHKNVKRNLGIYFYGYDRLLGTYDAMAKRKEAK